MIRILFLCEGQTELDFVNEILRPYFEARNAVITSRLFHTKNVPVDGTIPKGGLGSSGLSIWSWHKHGRHVPRSKLVRTWDMRSAFVFKESSDWR